MFTISAISSERMYLYIELRSQVWRSTVSIVVGSLMAAAYNILMFYLTMFTSALTNTMLGNVKQVIVVVITYGIVDVGEFAWINWVGILACFAVSAMYASVLTQGDSWSWRQAGAPLLPSGSRASEKTPLK
eukprot:CAMPEP_0181180978 /NCGR_PEP_ID=MMETSP1096-20121128/7095_1 /TAXON_ID=156174 ORGANISM="Chrysochromulina ericina, Strain CCMP281" /NCGR_SAMPLE_ID=MMETSP1096 /ASSEMBLY_ACC=CAM_ASM_000453 /LENGTH=130 /DNA_ID=CAMNT_0023269457 /DNA_START=1235 /DNA_END=1627 /DNA_ORIENTATION=+